VSPVPVIIPSWNGRHLLPFCLESLRRQEPPVSEVVVVDNGSSDGTAGWLRREFPEVRLLELRANTGFAAAVNLGISATTGDLLLVLNNDAALSPSYVGRLARFLAEHPGAAACQGRVLRHDDPTVVDSLGIRFDSLMRAFQIGHGRRDGGPAADPVEVEGVSACAALYRREALDQVADPGRPPGIFDPGFFAYYEDVDLALRLKAAGWRAFLLPDVSCEHVGSATGIADSMGKAFLLGRNYLAYLARHAGAGGLARLAPRLLLSSLRRLVTLPLHPRRDLAVLAGEAAALPRLPRALGKGRRDGRHAGKRGPRGPTA
jgi:GT2 family glycosyltransferase